MTLWSWVGVFVAIPVIIIVWVFCGLLALKVVNALFSTTATRIETTKENVILSAIMAPIALLLVIVVLVMRGIILVLEKFGPKLKRIGNTLIEPPKNLILAFARILKIDYQE